MVEWHIRRVIGEKLEDLGENRKQEKSNKKITFEIY